MEKKDECPGLPGALVFFDDPWSTEVSEDTSVPSLTPPRSERRNWLTQKPDFNTKYCSNPGGRATRHSRKRSVNGGVPSYGEPLMERRSLSSSNLSLVTHAGTGPYHIASLLLLTLSYSIPRVF
jgi:hypothetical protein